MADSHYANALAPGRMLDTLGDPEARRAASSEWLSALMIDGVHCFW